MNTSRAGYWYGDQWYYLRDAFSSLTTEEQFIFTAQSGIPLINDIELAHITGNKIKLAWQVMYFHALNEALRNNPEKFRPIFEKKGLIVDFRKLKEQANRPQQTPSFFQ